MQQAFIKKRLPLWGLKSMGDGAPRHTLRLREVELCDASSLAAISIEVWIGTYIKQGVSGFFAEYALETFTTQNLQDVIRDPKTHIIVSQNNEGIDGFIQMKHPSKGPIDACSDCEIATFYVQPRHHGKGIGQALLKVGCDYANSLGVSSLWLTTNAQNTPAIGFYQRQGFDIIGTTDFRIQDQAYENKVLSLSLIHGQT